MFPDTLPEYIVLVNKFRSLWSCNSLLLMPQKLVADLTFSCLYAGENFESMHGVGEIIFTVVKTFFLTITEKYTNLCIGNVKEKVAVTQVECYVHKLISKDIITLSETC
jgi:hypothetical protein